MLPLNHSLDTDGLDDPSQVWMSRIVRIKSRPDWGPARVVRWYPAVGDQPQQLRLVVQGVGSQQLVALDDVEVLDGQAKG